MASGIVPEGSLQLLMGSPAGLLDELSVHGKDATVSFDDGTVNASFLSWKAFRQLLAMKAAQNGKPKDVPDAAPVNGAE